MLSQHKLLKSSMYEIIDSLTKSVPSNNCLKKSKGPSVFTVYLVCNCMNVICDIPE